MFRWCATVEREDVVGVRDRIRVVYEDITRLRVAAIVNPAHRDLLGGGGLDGIIHDEAGPELLEACRALGGCEVGDAKVTAGFRLPARWVIHTVGPIWRGGTADEERLLASCYRRSLEEAAAVSAGEVAFPAISTGLHGFPVARAAEIGVREVASFLGESALPGVASFVCFSGESADAFEGALEGIVRDPRRN